MTDRVSMVAPIWWDLATNGKVSWRSVSGWCFGAAEATGSEEWFWVYQQAEARWDIDTIPLPAEEDEL